MEKTVGNDECEKIEIKLGILPREIIQHILARGTIRDSMNLYVAVNRVDDKENATHIKKAIIDYFNWVKQILSENINAKEIFVITIDNKDIYCLKKCKHLILLDELVDGVSFKLDDGKATNILTKKVESVDHIDKFLKIIQAYVDFCKVQIKKADDEMKTLNNNEKDGINKEKAQWVTYLKIFSESQASISAIKKELDKVGGKPRRRSFESLTVPQLKEYAKRKEIRGYSKLNKAELIAALRKTRK